MSDRKSVMISSTTRDLHEFREQVMHACLRQGMFPVMMEHLPANDADAIRASLGLVDQADIYLGVFAHRYGYVPHGFNISITEMEFNRAAERHLPRLTFLLSDDSQRHSEEPPESQQKLEAFKRRICTELIVNFFKSPDDLRAHVIDSLSRYRSTDTAQTFHYVSDIPPPPEAYIAHPYTLLQTQGLVGRRAELQFLTNWVSLDGAEINNSRVLSIVAIGGMGKSALTWKWFNEIAPQEMRDCAGRLWWSFYESDAHFDNFVRRALAYVTNTSLEEVERIPAVDRESRLLAALDREPFLIVMDGMERLLRAYAQMDAVRITDEELDARTSNAVAGIFGHHQLSAAPSGSQQLRKAADPRVGAFLRKMAQVRRSRILLSTRLYPADLQTGTGQPMPGSSAYYLKGLGDDDAFNLWQAFGVSGTRETLLSLFHTFDNYPLIIRSLAGEVAQYRRAPGDFDQWRHHHPDFDPFSLPLTQVKSHVLAFALQSLSEPASKLLHTIAAFRMPAAYEALVALLVGQDKCFSTEGALDAALTDLEERNLLGWDKRANRYDLHPVVRGITWSTLDEAERRRLYSMLEEYFIAIPPVTATEVKSLEDLTATIEHYNALIGLGDFDAAWELFHQRLQRLAMHHLSVGRQLIELLELLFPDGLDELPSLSNLSDQAAALNSLGMSYNHNGQPEHAARLYSRYIALSEDAGAEREVAIGLGNLSDVLRHSGALSRSEAAARRALLLQRRQPDHFIEAMSLFWLGLVLSAKGDWATAEKALHHALEFFSAEGNLQAEGVLTGVLSENLLRTGKPKEAKVLADRAWALVGVRGALRDMIRTARHQGSIALELSELEVARERLHFALTNARAVNLAQEEIRSAVALAELARRTERLKEARELLDDIWELAERGPYPMYLADAFNTLALVERDADNFSAAAQASEKAYRRAWCDGPPYTYAYGLNKAAEILESLGANTPRDLPPYNQSLYEPMVEVEIIPFSNDIDT